MLLSFQQHSGADKWGTLGVGEAHNMKMLEIKVRSCISWMLKEEIISIKYVFTVALVGASHSRTSDLSDHSHWPVTISLWEPRWHSHIIMA